MALDDHVKALDLNVDTKGSVVTVSGWVRTQAEKDRALQLARDTAGVTQVIENLQHPLRNYGNELVDVWRISAVVAVALVVALPVVLREPTAKAVLQETGEPTRSRRRRCVSNMCS